MPLKKCPKHGLYTSEKCPDCINEGISLCIHCGKDLTNLSVNEILEHLKTHKSEMTDRSKQLLEIVKDVDFDAINRY